MVFAIRGSSSEERLKFPLGLDLLTDRKSMNGWDAKAFNWSLNKLKHSLKSRLIDLEEIKTLFYGRFSDKMMHFLCIFEESYRES